MALRHIVGSIIFLILIINILGFSEFLSMIGLFAVMGIVSLLLK
ncbi:hypothetical protein SAMN02745728_02330 [Desulfovibrio litoralis DSM 11393]|uniref:Uncharacterized protein n=1 Tax=Desulfovibrio litoralis DSM 11393 TaxID=1121455 RepID=A0A1M7TPM8_9BACT|nr:hypothetical protein SAMN02745728_02330 [Desulfovibrio litoralis DSM 11393]